MLLLFVVGAFSYWLVLGKGGCGLDEEGITDGDGNLRGTAFASGAVAEMGTMLSTSALSPCSKDLFLIISFENSRGL